ncbi:ferredoxin [Kineococcus rhizosphaerae]|uniref:Ferredoxin n=1 Tax=Kineococcus rhizosphaerae TaxID=559628 RepID=A0A2T0R332_9ACTN|nr:ferredoxin [Kineococcus rhizosphaerae]PRY14477.1 ferredoxin [Kineococcus rhizosphaerae]
MNPAPGPAHELRIDFAACDGHGACADLLPELLATDDWGFPRVRGGGRRALVPDALLRAAREAERCCPVLALRVDRRTTAG